jgi:hypothetical protein
MPDGSESLPFFVGEAEGLGSLWPAARGSQGARGTPEVASALTARVAF